MKKNIKERNFNPLTIDINFTTNIDCVTKGTVSELNHIRENSKQQPESFSEFL